MPTPPKRPPTKTTRHGNGPGRGGPAGGAGYGGPAKGAGTSQAKQQKFGAGTNSQGHGKSTPAPFNRAELRREREDMVEAHMYYLAFNADAQRDQINACRPFMVDRKEFTGANGGPLHVIYTWDDGEADDPEAAASV